MSAFSWPQNCRGVVGEGRDEPKADEKIVIKSRVLCNNYWEGIFHTVPSSFVPH